MLPAHVPCAWLLVVEEDEALLHSVICAWMKAGDSAVCAGVKEYEVVARDCVPAIVMGSFQDYL